MTAYLAGSGPRAFAHRGWHTGSLAGCENSMAAFTRAADEGYRYVETDVHLTSDGQLIAFHDHHLDRVTDGHGQISRLPWSTVRRAKIGGREPVPLFSEVIQLLHDQPRLRLNVDPKTDAAVGPLIDQISASGVADRMCVGSFSDARVAAVSAALGPDFAVSVGPRGVARLASAAVIRSWMLPGAPRFPLGTVAVQVPVRFGRLAVVTPGFLGVARSAGLEVHVWTINDDNEMRRLLDLGVDGIMTDRPEVLRRVLAERGQWS